MPHALSRRSFLAASASTLFAGSALAGQRGDPPPLPSARPGPNDRIRIAIIGTNGQGNFNTNGVAQEEIVALCDVDQERAAAARKRFPRARFVEDFRRVVDNKDVDAVVISTPDHVHAPIAVAAMRAGKHVYCEKPLAWSVHEVRVMMETAARQRVVTQMGTQIHAGDNYRRVVELVQAGTIGAIRRVHVWCNRRPDPRQRQAQPPRVPATLNYNLWLGPAPEVPYDPAHLHFHWRWFWEFGGGVLADMACHFMDLPHWALNLRTPTTIAATGRVTYKASNNTPDLMQVDYEYPARGDQPPVHLTWYHGQPGPDLAGKVRYEGYFSGVLFEGERGQIIADYTKHHLMRDGRRVDIVRPPQTIPASLGHHREWLHAIRNRDATTTCNFAYSGALTVAVLLGNVAYRCGGKIQWDDKAGRVTNNRNAEQYLHRDYRKGWSL